ncbi:MAG TPA: hypothetical protein VFN78_14125 [Ktedonobacterales bacterium]|nr:hypothetical protein [Ktedonobacterales bacterium]
MAHQYRTQDEEQYLTASSAAKELGTTRAKIAKLIKSGVLPHIPNPLDGREKLVPLSAIDRLRQMGRRSDDPKVRRVA